MAQVTTQQYFNVGEGGVNTYVNPLLNDGQMIHCVNMDSMPLGGKTRRTGYELYLNNPDSNYVTTLFQFAKGTQFWNYRASGSLLYYSIQGTGDWTIAGNGTISNLAHVGHAVLANTLIIGDGVGSTRHTTNGTAFTNTTAAPVSAFFEQYQNRIYAVGTAGTVVYSSPFGPTDWTTDSSSFTIPGAGFPKQPFKSADRLILPKDSGEMYRWDGFALVDLSTTYGPSSPYSIAEVEGYKLYMNTYGVMGYGGNKPELLSNAIQNQIYDTVSSTSTAISASEFRVIPADTWYYSYLAYVGRVVERFTSREIFHNVIKYDFQKNEFLNYNFSHQVTACASFLDANGNRNFYFGDGLGRTYVMRGGLNTDSDEPIHSEMIFVFTFGTPEFEKKWNYLRLFFNPGCSAQISVACTNTYTEERLIWEEVGDVEDGVVEHRFPHSSQSRLLFLKIANSTLGDPYTYYGASISAEIERHE